jgi:TetR/AcrR family transcriptional regulator, transcriptional repressor of bet genes
MTAEQAASGTPKAGEKLSRARQRLKLIDACISALYLHGPSRTTIDKVVAIADMSPGIVNFYFETKAALMMAALEHLANEFDERVMAPLGALLDRPVEALDRLIELYLDPDIASPRKVSVWYAFWGEATSRREYFTICGKRDLAFADLVRDLVARLVAQTGAEHLDADAVALGLIGALEMIWQEIAFQDETHVDRLAAAQRCHAYLRSAFPAQFALHNDAESPHARQHMDSSPAASHSTRLIGDACALLVAAELTLAGVPALKAPEYWPGYNVIAQPRGRPPQRVLVKSGTFTRGAANVAYSTLDVFDWMAFVIFVGETRRCFVVPRSVIEDTVQKFGSEPAINLREYRIDDVAEQFAVFENNFCLRE